jgi:hypothetical protein
MEMNEFQRRKLVAVIIVVLGIVLVILQHFIPVPIVAVAAGFALIVAGAVAFRLVIKDEQRDRTRPKVSDFPDGGTDFDLWEELQWVNSFKDLIEILTEYPSGDFSRRENQEFYERAKHLRLSKQHWAQILEKVQGQGGFVEALARWGAA